MTELQWPPAVIGQLTLFQLLCLGTDRCPDEPAPITTAEDYMASIEREQAREETW